MRANKASADKFFRLGVPSVIAMANSVPATSNSIPIHTKRYSPLKCLRTPISICPRFILFNATAGTAGALLASSGGHDRSENRALTCLLRSDTLAQHQSDPRHRLNLIPARCQKDDTHRVSLTAFSHASVAQPVEFKCIECLEDGKITIEAESCDKI